LTIDNREYSQTNAVAFFGVLRVPELQRFEYRGPKYQSQLPFITIFSAIHTLEGLTIDMQGLTKNAFQHCIELLPSLTYLRLEAGTDYDPWSTAGQWGRENPPASANDILRLLTPDPCVSDECPCPFLTHLEVARCSPLADDVVFNFVRLRAEVEHPLQRVGIAFVRQREFDMMPYLGELVTQGLQIELTYLPAPLPPTYSPWEGRDAMA
jgi:hypothetical protein